jgi:hypothetical protein
VPRGRHWRSNLLVFSFDPRCQGQRGVTEVDVDFGRQCQAQMIDELKRIEARIVKNQAAPDRPN